jgi:hypothetical protein
VAAAQQAAVEAEDRHHASPGLERRSQGRVVANSQIPPQPEDGRGAQFDSRERLRSSAGIHSAYNVLR